MKSVPALRMRAGRVTVQREFGSLRSYSPATPFLKWAGGKAQLLTQLSPYFPKEFEVYFEPFLGGGGAFFHLRPERAVLSDTNPELVNYFQVVGANREGAEGALYRN